MLILTADEEVGHAGVGAPFFVEAKPDLSPDYIVGEGAGERFATPRGPLGLDYRQIGAEHFLVGILGVCGAEAQH